MKVVRRKDEDFDILFARFKRGVQTSGIMVECRKREFFMNPREQQIFKQSLRKKKRSK